MSVAAENNLYHTLNTVVAHSQSPLLYPELNQRPENKTIQIAKDKISGKLAVDEIFLRSAHTKEDLIVRYRNSYFAACMHIVHYFCLLFVLLVFLEVFDFIANEDFCFVQL